MTRGWRDVAGGVIVAAVAAFLLAGALRMRVGTALEMGPGYFPMLVSSVAVILGLLIAAGGLARSGAIQDVHWRPMLAVLGAIAAFAVILGQIGLIPAMIVGVAIAASGDATSRWRQTLLVAVGAALASWLVFRVGLGLQMPGLRMPAWLA